MVSSLPLHLSSGKFSLPDVHKDSVSRLGPSDHERSHRRSQVRSTASNHLPPHRKRSTQRIFFFILCQSSDCQYLSRSNRVVVREKQAASRVPSEAITIALAKVFLHARQAYRGACLLTLQSFSLLNVPDGHLSARTYDSRHRDSSCLTVQEAQISWGGESEH